MTTTLETLKPLLWELKNLVRAIEAAGVTLWSWNVDVDADALAIDDHPIVTGGAAFTVTRAMIGA